MISIYHSKSNKIKYIFQTFWVILSIQSSTFNFQQLETKKSQKLLI